MPRQRRKNAHVNLPQSNSEVAIALSPWLDRLQKAREPEAVVEVTRAYLASWSPQRLAAMPKLPEAIGTDEISATALMLIQRMHADLEGNPDLLEMAEFFAAASRRLAETIALATRGAAALERRPFF